MPDVRPVEKLKSISCELQAKSADKRLIKIFIGKIWLLPWPGKEMCPHVIRTMAHAADQFIANHSSSSLIRMKVYQLAIRDFRVNPFLTSPTVLDSIR